MLTYLTAHMMVSSYDPPPSLFIMAAKQDMQGRDAHQQLQMLISMIFERVHKQALLTYKD